MLVKSAIIFVIRSAAREGSEFELAKIALLLLMNCVRLEIVPYAESCDDLASDDYDTVANFYALMNQRNMAIHALPMKFYEEFLSMSETKRRSIVRENGTAMTSAGPRTPASAAHKSSAARYLCSPMAKASLFSPNRAKKKQAAEEDLAAAEKQRLERELKNKEFDMFALQDEIKYKDEELAKTKSDLEEARRALLQLKKFKQSAEECEILVEKVLNFHLFVCFFV